jgi:CTP synthase
VAALDAADVYFVPLNLRDEGLDRLVIDKLEMKAGPLDLTEWNELVEKVRAKSGTVRIALVGKYVQLQDAYLSVVEALRHAGIHHGRDVEIVWVDAETLKPEEIRSQLAAADGILVPGGFGVRGIEGKILAVQYARENNVPFLGICLGLQVAAVEFARHVGGMIGANSAEFDPSTPYAVIDLLPEQKDLEDKGGTMRLGSYPTKVMAGTKAFEAYGEEVIYERHRHRYEFNNVFRAPLLDKGLIISGLSPDDRLVEMVELPDHPWFVATQAHPEFKSRPTRPQPLFRDFVGAAIACGCGAGGPNERAAGAERD